MRYQHNNGNVETYDLTPVIHELVRNIASLLKLLKKPEQSISLLNSTISERVKPAPFRRVLSEMVDDARKCGRLNFAIAISNHLLNIKSIFEQDQEFFMKNFTENIPQENQEEFVTRYTEVAHEIVKEHVTEVIQTMRKEIEEKKKEDQPEQNSAVANFELSV